MPVLVSGLVMERREVREGMVQAKWLHLKILQIIFLSVFYLFLAVLDTVAAQAAL